MLLPEFTRARDVDVSIRAFRTLQAIARHGSFARAGAAVGLTQSAVSLQVKGLESEFGAQLFDRSRRLPALTEAGMIVLAKAEEILALYDEIGFALSDERSLAGRLKLGAMQSVLGGILPEALAALNHEHPRVRVHVAGGMSADLAAKVAAGDLDAAVTTEPVRPYPQDLVWTPLYDDRFWIVAPPGNDQRSPQELLTGHPFIRLDTSAWAGRLIDRELRRLRLDVRDEMVFDSLDVILRMVGNGLGVAIVALTDEARSKLNLTCLPFGSPQLGRNVVLLERHDRRGGQICEALVRAVVTLKAKLDGAFSTPASLPSR